MLIKGKAAYTRVVGQPHKNKFNPDVDQWSFDLTVDKEAQQTLLEAGMRKTYLRDKEDFRETFISFTRDATKKDGSPGKPYEIVDAQGQPWPEDVLIGNGSVLNVIVTLNERTFRGEKFLKPSCIKLQVWQLVEYKKADFPERPAEDGTPIKTPEEW